MDISEKLTSLRKARNLTQEELAEKLDVSRQSVSKWETGQCVPDADKLTMLSDIFNVSVDFLLKPSELDLLTIKAETLENQQKKLESAVRRKEKQKRLVLGCATIYLIAFAVILTLHLISFRSQILWEIFPGAALPVIVLLAATAAAVIFYIKNMSEKKE